MSHEDTGHVSDWRVAVKGEQRGPFSLEQVRAMIAEGRLPADALVWRPGMANWAPVGSVPELAAPVGRGPMPAATSPAPAASASTMATSAAASPAARNAVADFLAFRIMLTPVLMQVLFWVGIAGCILAAIGQIVMGFLAHSIISGLFAGVITLIVGPVVVRVYCELIILLFRIYDTLQEIKEQRKPTSGK